eukprot:3290089-Rhodomonas_salina.1
MSEPGISPPRDSRSPTKVSTTAHSPTLPDPTPLMKQSLELCLEQKPLSPPADLTSARASGWVLYNRETFVPSMHPPCSTTRRTNWSTTFLFSAFPFPTSDEVPDGKDPDGPVEA